MVMVVVVAVSVRFCCHFYVVSSFLPLSSFAGCTWLTVFGFVCNCVRVRHVLLHISFSFSHFLFDVVGFLCFFLSLSLVFL